MQKPHVHNYNTPEGGSHAAKKPTGDGPVNDIPTCINVKKKSNKYFTHKKVKKQTNKKTSVFLLCKKNTLVVALL